MIISKVRLRKSPGAQGALAKILLDSAAGDRGHGLIWSLFSETGEEERRSREGMETPLFLFREIEPGAFMIVSRVAPRDPHGLWEIAPPKEYAPALACGQKLGFVLRANPVTAVKRPGAKRGLRADAIMHAKFKAGKGARGGVPVETVALDWLYRREAALGAVFDRERCAANGYRQVRVPHKKEEEPDEARAGGEAPRKRFSNEGGTMISFSEIDYEGVLTVTDPAKFAQALFAGVGKAKAYGCGLLLVRPV